MRKGGALRSDISLALFGGRFPGLLSPLSMAMLLRESLPLAPPASKTTALFFSKLKIPGTISILKIVPRSIISVIRQQAVRRYYDPSADCSGIDGRKPDSSMRAQQQQAQQWRPPVSTHNGRATHGESSSNSWVPRCCRGRWGLGFGWYSKKHDE